MDQHRVTIRSRVRHDHHPILWTSALLCLPFVAFLLAFAPGFAPWVAPVALVYATAIAQWWNVTDEESEDANRGWKRFLALNFIAGFAVTMALIAYELLS